MSSWRFVMFSIEILALLLFVSAVVTIYQLLEWRHEDRLVRQVERTRASLAARDRREPRI
jgi:hypothetical protein